VTYKDSTMDFFDLEEDELRSFSDDDGTRSDILQHVFGKLLDKKKRIAIEFECGDCCKKVLNGAKIFTFKGLLFLLPSRGECLFLKVISCGKVAEKQILNFIIIPLERVCAIEFGAIQVDP